MDILTYGYFKWEKENPTEFDGMKVEEFTAAYHRLEENGMLDCVNYAGKMLCSCGWTDPLGYHYGFILVGDEEQTKKMLEVINCDTHESFDANTMDKLDKDFKKDEDYFKEYERQLNKVLAAMSM